METKCSTTHKLDFLRIRHHYLYKKPTWIAVAIFYPKNIKIKGDGMMAKAVSIVLFNRDWQGNDLRWLRITGRNFFPESKGALRYCL
jgi:hypothetical protein